VSTTRKNQHYVWQYYLKAWAKNEKLYCFRQRDKKLISTNTKNIASETYFYRTHELTRNDLAYLEQVISKSSNKALQEVNRGFIGMFQMAYSLKKKIENSHLDQDVKLKIIHELEIAEKTMGEHYHTIVESECEEIIRSLRENNSAFYEDETRCSRFLYFISNQYFRTSKMRNVVTSLATPFPGHDLRRTWLIESHIYATNVGASLYLDRTRYRIVFFENATNVPFVTADQPVINLLDTSVNDVELFYPLSPSLAIALTNDEVKYPKKRRALSNIEVETYNFLIYQASEDQVYSNDRDYLNSLIELPKDILG
jgi:hypothetical protein